MVKGHAKNSCDRLFNLLKKDFRKQQARTCQSALQALNSNREVNVAGFDNFTFNDWSTYLDASFSSFPASIIARHHVFEAKASNPGYVCCRRSDSSKIMLQVDFFSSNKKNRIKMLDAATMEEIAEGPPPPTARPSPSSQMDALDPMPLARLRPEGKTTNATESPPSLASLARPRLDEALPARLRPGTIAEVEHTLNSLPLQSSFLTLAALRPGRLSNEEKEQRKQHKKQITELKKIERNLLKKGSMSR